jgi:hypothetical protein
MDKFVTLHGPDDVIEGYQWDPGPIPSLDLYDPGTRWVFGARDLNAIATFWTWREMFPRREWVVVGAYVVGVVTRSPLVIPRGVAYVVALNGAIEPAVHIVDRPQPLWWYRAKLVLHYRVWQLTGRTPRWLRLIFRVHTCQFHKRKKEAWHGTTTQQG